MYLTSGYSVQSCHDIVILCEVGFNRVLTGDELCLHLCKPDGWAGEPERGELEGFSVNSVKFQYSMYI